VYQLLKSANTDYLLSLLSSKRHNRHAATVMAIFSDKLGSFKATYSGTRKTLLFALNSYKGLHC